MHIRVERSRWFAVLAALAIIASSLLVTTVTGRLASGNGAPPPLTVTTDAAHPGMMYVQWHQPGAAALRLQWSSNGGNASEAILVPSQGTSRDGIIIPNLTAGTYSVTTSVVTSQQQEWHATVSAQATVAQSAPAANCPDFPRWDPNTQQSTPQPATICGTLTGLPAGAAPWLYVYADGASSMMYLYDTGPHAGQFTWTPPPGQPHTTANAENFFGVSPFMRARLQFLDATGSAVSQWWAAFGETGNRFDTGTDVLVPMSPSGGPVRLDFDLGRITNFMTLEGEITKDVNGVATQLASTDFERLCIQVFEASQIAADERIAYSQVMCAGPQPGGFIDPTDGNRGKWRIKLPTGNYRVRFQDEPNYATENGTLVSNVKFAPEWCCGTMADRAEQRLDGQTRALATTTSGLNVSLRPAKQLQVTVSGVPADYATQDTQASIVVGDDFGNWTGGAMALSSATTWTAFVTGLVEGRAYKIFLSFSRNGFPTRWWLVGGGTLESAEGIVPGDQLTEPWQPAPYLVTLHHTDGTPLGANDGCVAVLPLNDDTPLASNCTNDHGEVPLQRLVAGRYRVIAWTADGESIMEVGEFDVTANQTMSTVWTDHAIGIADTSALVGSLPGGYDTAGAVVMAGSTAPPPRFLVTIHQADGTPMTNGAACIEMEPTGGGTATGPECTDGSGIAVIGPVAPGPHTVRVRTGGTVAFTYTYDVPQSPNTFDWGVTTYAIGLANTSNLPQQVSLPDGYPDWLAVVLP